MIDRLGKILFVTPEQAYKINLWMYGVHVLIGVYAIVSAYFFQSLHTMGLKWLLMFITPPAIEFYFYVWMFKKFLKKKFNKSIVRINLFIILIFLFVATFTVYPFLFSYFVVLLRPLLNVLEVSPVLYALLMGSIWTFYFLNLVFWSRKLAREN